MGRVKDLLEIISNGEFHSGEEIGKKLNISRAAVWKIVKSAENAGIKIVGIRNQGYKLSHPLVLLDKQKICNILSDETLNKLKIIEIFEKIDSTNDYLLKRIYERTVIPRVCLAEYQTQARGRYERKWHAPYAQNIYLSLLWRFDNIRPDFQTLPLIMGVAVVKTLEKLRLTQTMQLKWPNDIWIDAKKIGGVLIETRGEMSTEIYTVIGIGLNVNMANAPSGKINQMWTSLLKTTGKYYDRNLLVAKLIDEILRCIAIFDSTGFSAFKSIWSKYDCTYQKKVTFQSNRKIITGTAHGVDELGRLKIITDDEKEMKISVGDVSLKF